MAGPSFGLDFDEEGGSEGAVGAGVVCFVTGTSADTAIQEARCLGGMEYQSLADDLRGDGGKGVLWRMENGDVGGEKSWSIFKYPH